MRQPQFDRAGLCEAQRQRQIAPHFPQAGRALVAHTLAPNPNPNLILTLSLSLTLHLREPHARHAGPHQGPVHAVVLQHLQTGVVAGVLQPGVQKAPGQVSAAAGFQVHGQKGNVGHAVDPAQCGVELDRIEQLRLPVDQHQVGQVQVAVAFADAAAGLAGSKRGFDTGELGAGPGFEGVEARGLARQPGAQGGEVVESRGQHLGGLAEARVGPGDRRRVVEGDDEPGELG